MPEVLESAALIDKEQAILARGTHLLASLPEIYVRLAGFLFSARFPVLGLHQTLPSGCPSL
jgi:hypothetical protein